MRRVMGLATGVRRYLVIAVALQVAVTVTFVAQGLLLARVLQRMLAGADFVDQAGLLAGVVVIALIRFALTWTGDVVGQLTAVRTKQELRTRAFAKIAELGPGFTSAERTGQLKTAMVEGIESLEAYYARYVPSLVAVALTPLIVLAVLAGQDVWSALIVAGFIIAALILPKLWSKMMKRRGDALMEAYVGMGATVLDTLQGLVTLKAFGATGRRRTELAKVSDRLITGWNRVMAAALITHMIYTLAIVGGTAVTVAVASVRAANGSLDAGVLLVVLVLSGEALRAVGVLATSFHASYDAAGAAEVLHGLFAQQPPAPESPKARRVAELEPAIAFEDVVFGYRDERDVLRGVDLRVGRGETVAVIGPSGAGKSTVVALLLRFVDPQRGRITIGGHDLRDLPLDQLRSMVAVVAQDTYLFGGSVRDNIAMARPEATDDEVTAAARIANAHEFIEALPDGYGTEIGERGLRLSGGQRQRLAIARAVLADAPILVLDEATASVDAAAEASIQSALDRLTQDRTTLVIAHRLSTIRDADQIVVLDDGLVHEVGTHADLLAHGGRYTQLLSAQEVH